MNMKIKWLRNKMNMLDIQGMIISNPKNIKYLTDIDAEGTLLITRKENIYITDARYIEKVHNIITISDEIIVYDIKDVSKDDYENFFMFCENVGFEEEYVTYSKYKEYMYKYKINNLVETENVIEKQRMIKDDIEIENIKKACQITDNCFSYILGYIKKGKTEKEIAFEIERYFKLNGAEGISFDTIVASGKNSSMPHAVPTDKKIESGDLITLDFGCKYNGYCSDMTRTIFMDYIPEEAKLIYDLLLKTQEKIINIIKDGVNTKTLYISLENDFKLNGYDLVHSLGHGIGMDIHELPFVYKKDSLLKENMIITIEPGIYIPGKFGIRIEDDILITKNGCIEITNSEKNYIIIH